MTLSSSLRPIPVPLPSSGPQSLSPRSLPRAGLLICTASSASVVQPCTYFPKWRRTCFRASAGGGGWQPLSWPSVPCLPRPQLSQKPSPLHAKLLHTPDWSGSFLLEGRMAGRRTLGPQWGQVPSGVTRRVPQVQISPWRTQVLLVFFHGWERKM